MDYLVAMLVKRPYVIGLVVTFVVVAAAERGWRRMAIWLVSATFLGWLSEYCSTRTGFPYGFYDYYPASFADELWLSNVPLFASLSFAGLSYLGFSWTYTLFARLRRGPTGIERVEDRRLMRSLPVAVAASLLITWSDLVMDPITHLGEYWFLGKIYMYKAGSFGWLDGVYRHLRPSWHFDVPLSNYAGWVFTFFTIVWVNQRIDDVLAACGVEERPAFDLPHRPLWSLGYFLGNFAFMLSVNLYLAVSPAVPAGKRVGWMLVNTAVLSGAFVVFNLLVLRWKLRASPGASRRSIRPRAVQAGLLAVGGLLAGAVLVEAGCRIWGWSRGVDHRVYLHELTNSDTLALGIWASPEPGPLATLVERAYRRYPPLKPGSQTLATTSDYTVVYTIGRHGLRDREYDLDKRPGVTRILAFGDSFTFGTGVEQAQCFTEIVERSLADVEVLNMGVPGYGLDQMLLSFLAQGRRYRPDVVLVFLSTHVTGRHRTGMVQGDTVQLPQDLESVALTGAASDTAYLAADDPLWSSGRSWIVRHSSALALLTYRLQVRRLQQRLQAEDERFWRRQIAINRQATLQEDVDAARRARTLTLLQEFRRAVEASGARLMVVNIDNRVAMSFLASEPGLDVVDLAPELMARAKTAALTFTYDQHYNAATHRFIGERVAEELQRRASLRAGG